MFWIIRCTMSGICVLEGPVRTSELSSIRHLNQINVLPVHREILESHLHEAFYAFATYNGNIWIPYIFKPTGSIGILGPILMLSEGLGNLRDREIVEGILLTNS